MLAPTKVSELASPTLQTTEGVLPKMVFGVASGGLGSFPLFECRGNALPGRVVLAPTPFGRLELLTVDAQDSYYNPVWDPNGEWIAFVQVRKTEPIERIVSDQLILDYPESDSVWVMRADGSDRHQISGVYLRQEGVSTHNTGDACDVVGGILEISGWSSDSQWVLMRLAEVGKPGAIVAINVESRQAVTLDSEGYASVWAPEALTVASISHRNASVSTSHVEIESIATSDRNMSQIELPFNAVNWVATDLIWDLSGAGFSVLAVRSQGLPDKGEIWHHSLDSGLWEKSASVRGSLVRYFPEEHVFVGCTRDSFLVESSEDGTVLHEILSSDRIDCSEARIVDDDQGKRWIAFMTYDSRKIWISPLMESNVELLVDLDKLGVEVQLGVSGMSWDLNSK